MKINVGIMDTEVDFEHDTLLQEKVHGIMHTELGVKVDGAHYSRAYRSGHWDGISDFYNFQEDMFHTGLLPQFLKGIRKLQDSGSHIQYEIIDNRPPQLVHPDSIDEEISLGGKDGGTIVLRDYQHEAVASIFREKVGIVNIATNGGKCVHKDTQLTTSQGLMSMETFFNKEGYEAIESDKTVPYEGNISLVNRYGELEKPSHLTFNGLKEIRHIKGHRGTINKVTNNHPLLVVDEGGDFVWKNAKDIVEGEYLVARIGDNIFGSNTTLSEEESYAIGAIVADGYIGNGKTVSFSTSETEIYHIVRDYLQTITVKEGYKVIEKDPRTSRYEIVLNDSVGVSEWHQRVGIPKGLARNKEVPRAVLEGSKKIQMRFLEGYLESESHIHVDKKSIDVVSASYKLVQQVGGILRNVGLVPTIKDKHVEKYKDTEYYELSLGTVDTLKILKEMKFKTPKARKEAEELIERASKQGRNNKKETVPYGKTLAIKYRESYEKGNEPKGLRKKFTIPKTISKTRLRDLIQEFDGGDKELKGTLARLSSEEYIFEKVVEIEKQEPIPTFDVSMPKTNSFMAEGIVNHNTLASAGIMQQILPYLERGERIAFFTHSRELFKQSAEAIQLALGLKDNEIGRIGDGKFDIKNKKIVFVMIPTLNSALKDPKKGMKFTPKERVIKFMAELAPKFHKTQNTRQLLRNYIQNSKLTTKVWESALEHIQYIAYDKKFTDKTALMQLNKYVVEFDKIVQKKNKTKFDKYRDTMDFLESVKLMVADEVHRAKADTWYVNLSHCKNADYRVGLTGTVDKDDEMGWQRLQAVFSEVVSKVSNDYLISIGVSSKPMIRMVPMTEPRNIELIDEYLNAYKAGIVENDVRNETIVKLAQGYNQRKPGAILISIKEIEHGNRLLEMLQEKDMDVDFIHGGSDDEHRANTLEKFSNGELDIMIASTIIDEGVDMKSIGCMIMGAGGKSMRQQLQRIGRGLRLNGIDGNRVVIFDFIDSTNRFLKKHSEERMKIFKEEKFDVKNLGE